MSALCIGMAIVEKEREREREGGREGGGRGGGWERERERWVVTKIHKLLGGV